SEQRVAEPRAAREIGGPVTRVHVADGDEISGPCKRERLFPPAALPDGDGAVDFGEARRQPGVTPAGVDDAIRHRWLYRTEAVPAPGPRRASCRRPGARSLDR